MKWIEEESYKELAICFSWTQFRRRITTFCANMFGISYLLSGEKNRNGKLDTRICLNALTDRPAHQSLPQSSSHISTHASEKRNFALHESRAMSNGYLFPKINSATEFCKSELEHFLKAGYDKYCIKYTKNATKWRVESLLSRLEVNEASILTWSADKKWMQKITVYLSYRRFSKKFQIQIDSTLRNPAKIGVITCG